MFLLVDFSGVEGACFVHRNAELLCEASLETIPSFDVLVWLGSGDGVLPMLGCATQTAYDEADALGVRSDGCIPCDSGFRLSHELAGGDGIRALLGVEP